MMMWHAAERKRDAPVTSATPDYTEVVKVGDVLRDAVAALGNAQQAFGFEWHALSGSRLHAELNNTETGPSGAAWGPGPVSLAQQQAQFWLRLATDRLTGLGVLYVNSQYLASPWPLARAVVEGAAATAWVASPAITVRQRAARAALFELDDRRHTRNAAAAAAGVQASAYGTHPSPEADAFNDYKDKVQELFHAPILSGAWDVEGEHLPGLTELVQTFIDTELRGGSGGEAYSLLSGQTHPSTSAYLALLQPAGDGYVLRESPSRRVTLAQLAVIAHYRVFRTVFDWFGLKWADLGFWIDHVNAVLPDAIRDVP
jgi:hypothetical protein